MNADKQDNAGIWTATPALRWKKQSIKQILNDFPPVLEQAWRRQEDGKIKWEVVRTQDENEE